MIMVMTIMMMIMMILMMMMIFAYPLQGGFLFYKKPRACFIED